MADRAWKAFERRMCRDVGTERIPVTGERNGADGETDRFCFQFKLRQIVSRCLIVWLDGIADVASRKGKTGALVLKRPRMADADALVVLRWSDFTKIHNLLSISRQSSSLSERNGPLS